MHNLRLGTVIPGGDGTGRQAHSDGVELLGEAVPGHHSQHRCEEPAHEQPNLALTGAAVVANEEAPPSQSPQRHH